MHKIRTRLVGAVSSAHACSSASRNIPRSRGDRCYIAIIHLCTHESTTPIARGACGRIRVSLVIVDAHETLKRFCHYECYIPRQYASLVVIVHIQQNCVWNVGRHRRNSIAILMHRRQLIVAVIVVFVVGRVAARNGGERGRRGGTCMWCATGGVRG